MKPWFDRDPELLEREINALQELGAAVQVDEDARAGGVLRLLIKYPTTEGSVTLVGHYPDLYPFFRPEVLAPYWTLPRHQEPNSKGLCLVGRRTSHWFASETLASVLEQQFPRLLELAKGGDVEDLIPFEEPQGEPFSDYYNAKAPTESLMLLDSSWVLDPAIKRGTFTAMCREVERPDLPSLTVVGFISQIKDVNGVVLAQHEGPPVVADAEARTGRWLRLERGVLGDINTMIDGFSPQDRAWLKAEETWSKKRHLSLSAVIYPEEVQHRQFADGWAIMQWLSPRVKKGQAHQASACFIRTARAGLADLAARMPVGRHLEGKSVLLIGAGAIGAPVALELARAGLGRLILVDHDQVEPATVRRWPIGLPAFGQSKVALLKERIEVEYPWTTVTAERLRVGVTEDPSPEPKQGEILAALFDQADLVLDCTAEMGVNHILSELARLRAKSFVIGSSTPGGWGGRVAHFNSGGVCWLCYRHALYGEAALPAPPHDPAGELQPPGCADPTFTGSAFDLAEVGLELVRTVCGLLTAGEGGYPAPPWQALFLSMRGEKGERVPPFWTAPVLVPRPGCYCAR